MAKWKRHEPVSVFPDMMAFIVEYSQEHGYPPTMKEIAVATGFSSLATVDFHLSKMLAKGLITQQFKKPRTIVVTDKGKEHLAWFTEIRNQRTAE